MRCRVQTKACKRCGGDLSPERDNYGTYLQCIQCGAVVNEQLARPFQNKVKEVTGHEKLVRT